MIMLLKNSFLLVKDIHQCKMFPCIGWVQTPLPVIAAFRAKFLIHSDQTIKPLSIIAFYMLDLLVQLWKKERGEKTIVVRDQGNSGNSIYRRFPLNLLL